MEEKVEERKIMKKKRMSPGRRARRLREAYLINHIPEVFLKEICEALEAGTSLAVFLASKDVRVNAATEWLESDPKNFARVRASMKVGRLARKNLDLEEIQRFDELGVRIDQYE